MKKTIASVVIVGLVCGLVGFRVGREGMMPRADHDRYVQKVHEAVRDYERHYFAMRERMTELFEYMDVRERFFYRDMPESLRGPSDRPQCVVDLFGNLDKWRLNYLERTKTWDSQVKEIRTRISSGQ